jgi:hypothetical protein
MTGLAGSIRSSLGADNEITTSVSNKNIYAFSNDSSRIEGDTASFTAGAYTRPLLSST